ncbi:MAG TPA: cyclopropane-fatty-acyl-phospholipid synthase family protein [Chthoniobacteraceae bacterium]|jgi:cyclopropane-fatty-acyl-phospholipid synthase|nr:cyclopropane-fatty-acyl-phospholipid synthase family protein [Chthoniobacteraceae bacterium]
MNQELSLDIQETRAATAGGGLCEALVFRTLKKMQRGHMEIALPDGRRWTLGKPGAEVTARFRVRRQRFFQRLVFFGDIGLGESYVEGDWDTEDIQGVIAWFILNIEDEPARLGSRVKTTLVNLLRGWNRLHHRMRPNSVPVSRRNISEHYDLGNEFYALWLDPTMTYSSAIFTGPGQSLEVAQRAKYDALCDRLRLAPGDRVLEIGCGWGGFAEHAATRHGCHITAVTISQAQYDFARMRIQRAGLEDRVEIRLQDYRQINGQFDKIASIEMMEALGDRYLETYFSRVHALLAPRGLAAFQYITVPDCRHAALKRGVDWIQRHIFPGSLLLSVGRVNEALNRTGDLFLHGLDDYGSSYARTLQLWRDAFNAQLENVRKLGFDDRFIRKWNYYLSYCEAAFAMRNISVVQAVYTRPNNLSLP